MKLAKCSLAFNEVYRPRIPAILRQNDVNLPVTQNTRQKSTNPAHDDNPRGITTEQWRPFRGISYGDGRLQMGKDVRSCCFIGRVTSL